MGQVFSAATDSADDFSTKKLSTCNRHGQLRRNRFSRLYRKKSPPRPRSVA